MAVQKSKNNKKYKYKLKNKIYNFYSLKSLNCYNNKFNFKKINII